MATIVIYYSYSGNTAKYSANLAKKEGADLYEIKNQKQLGKFKMFVAGCFKSIRHETLPVEPIKIDFAKYDKFIICAPIWAGNPAPQINNVFDLLPKDKEIELHMISGSGGSSKNGVINWLKTKGLTVSKYVDTK